MKTLSDIFALPLACSRMLQALHCALSRLPGVVPTSAPADSDLAGAEAGATTGSVPRTCGLRFRSAVAPPLGRLPLLTLVLSVGAFATWAIPGAAAAVQFDRSAIGGGEFWRLVTGHWAHWGADHLTWDLIVFAVFGALIERHSHRGFVAVVAGSVLAISAALWLAAPQLQFYRGLSGIDSALFAAFFAQLLRAAWRQRSLLQAVVPVLALVGFVSKSAYELATGATLFVDSAAAFVAVPLAHVAGAAVGVAASAVGRCGVAGSVSLPTRSRPFGSSSRSTRRS